MRKRRPYFKTAERVVAAFDRNPNFTSGQLGKLLSLDPGYVRKALHRNGRRTSARYKLATVQNRAKRWWQNLCNAQARGQAVSSATIQSI